MNFLKKLQWTYRKTLKKNKINLKITHNKIIKIP